MGLIHDKIKDLRIKKGFKQADIAKAAGLTNAAVGRIENGITASISIDTGIAIANVLGIPFTELFEIEVSDIKSKELQNQFLELKETNQELESRLKEKESFIKLLESEKKNQRVFMAMLFVSNYKFLIDTIDQLINDTTSAEYKNRLGARKSELQEFEKNMIKRYIEQGLFTRADLEYYIKYVMARTKSFDCEELLDI